MATTEKTKIIDEVRELTSQKVAEKQDAAKLNYPKIINKIKQAAKMGESFVYMNESEINTYDKQLLEKDGFVVWYTTMPQPKWAQDNFKHQFIGEGNKGWKISW